MEPERSRRWGLLAAVAALVVLTSVVVVTVYLPGRTTNNPTGRDTVRQARPEDAVENAREALARSSNLTVCRQAVQEMNSYLSRSSGDRPPPLTPEQRDLLQKEFKLDDDEQAEVSSGTFTLLDGHHLDLCFLLRDALRSLHGQDESAKPPPAAEQAAAAFAWVVRQVYQSEPRGGEPVPPQFVLRRGHGSALERALVFLAVLHQLRVPGCLVVLPDGDDRRLWACGAVVEQDGGKQLLLFDPRLGLPLPGPGGKGIATLADARTKPEVLKQLTVDDKHPYDVTPEQAGKAELLVASPLSALAPRMGYLEAKLQDATGTFKAQAVSVRLAADAAVTFALLREAAGKDTPVKVAGGAVRGLRHFLPPEDGGVDRDRPGRLNQLRTEMVPWDRLRRDLRALEGEPGQRLHNVFALPFLVPMLEPGKPRDSILRGQFNEAAEALVAGQDELRRQKDQLKPLPENWEAQLNEWIGKIYAAHAALLKVSEKEGANSAGAKEASARQMEVWKEGGPLLQPLVLGQAAEPREIQLKYLVALCKHEEAEQQQARSDRLQDPTKADRDRARRAWETAALEWDRLLNEHPSAREAVRARRHLARARAMLNDPEGAARWLQDLTDLPEPEKIAHLYLARQVRGKP